jgi:hypothetical protein
VRSLVAALLILAATAPGASAATGSISGTVTDRATGAPVAGGCVFLYAGESTQPFVEPSTKTAADGTYSFADLATGSAYRVEFRPYSPFAGDVIPPNSCFSSANYFGAWYKDADGASTATRVTVTDGAATTGIDQQLDPAASIGGRVTDAKGKPVARACVTLDGGDKVPTGGDGRYVFQYLDAGTYALDFGVRGSFLAAPATIRCTDGYAIVRRSYTVIAGQEITDADVVLSNPGKPRPRITADARCQPVPRDEVRCRVHGRLRPDKTLSDIARRKVCTGSVTIRYTVGERRLARDRVGITPRCRYAATSVVAIDPALRGRLAVRVRYGGNRYSSARQAEPDRSVFPIH